MNLIKHHGMTVDLLFLDKILRPAWEIDRSIDFSNINTHKYIIIRKMSQEAKSAGMLTAACSVDFSMFCEILTGSFTLLDYLCYKYKTNKGSPWQTSNVLDSADILEFNMSHLPSFKNTCERLLRIGSNKLTKDNLWPSSMANCSWGVKSIVWMAPRPPKSTDFNWGLRNTLAKMVVVFF